MSGLSTEKRNGGGGNIYLKVMAGMLVQDVKEGTEGAVERLNKNKERVFELLYTGLTMRITNIAIIEGKFGKELEVKGNNEGQNYVLQTPAGSGYAYGILTRMVNLDFNLDTEIVPYQIAEKKDGVLTGKTNNIIVLYQGLDEATGKAKKIESAFTKENDFNGMPQIVKLKDPKDPTKDLLKQGKPVWDDSERIEFFENIIYGENGINDKLISLYGSAQSQSNSEDKSGLGNEDESDLENAELEKSKQGNAVDTTKAKAVAKANDDTKKSKKK